MSIASTRPSVRPLVEKQVPRKQGGADKRRWARTEHRRTFAIHPVRDGQLGPAEPSRARDFSSMGIGLVHPRRLAAGEQFVIALATQSGPPIPLLYRVVHCRSLKNGLYAVGGQLVSLLDLAQVAKRLPPGQSVAGYLRKALD